MLSLKGFTAGRIVRPGLACAFILLCTVACAQAEKPAPKKAPPPDLSGATLTVKDMNDAFAKLEGILVKVAGIQKSSAPSIAKSSDKPATREQVLLNMGRLFEQSKPKFKYTPNMISYDPAAFTIPQKSPARALLEKLVPWQCVGKTGPLVAGAKPGMTLGEFGDAIGFFSARIADLTHMPSNQWSVAIKERPMGDDGPPPAK